MRKGAIELQFHWIFVLIAGAVILTFFVTTALKQRAIAEQRIALEASSEFETILAGAVASPGTIHRIEIPKVKIHFVCNPDTGYAAYRVEGSPRDVLMLEPFSAPATTDSRILYLWTLPWRMPFKATNFVLIASPEIFYILVHEDDSFYERINAHLPSAMPIHSATKEQLSNLNPQAYDRIRIISLIPINNIQIPIHWHKKKIDAVRLTPTSIEFYEWNQKGKNFITKPGFKLSNIAEQLGRPEALLYAAMFTESAEAFHCNLRKALKRLSTVSSILASKAAELSELAAADIISCASYQFNQLKSEIKTLANKAASAADAQIGQFVPPIGETSPLEKLGSIAEEISKIEERHIAGLGAECSLFAK